MKYCFGRCSTLFSTFSRPENRYFKRVQRPLVRNLLPCVTVAAFALCFHDIQRRCYEPPFLNCQIHIVNTCKGGRALAYLRKVSLFPSPFRYLVACYLAEKDEFIIFSPGTTTPHLSKLKGHNVWQVIISTYDHSIASKNINMHCPRMLISSGRWCKISDQYQ